MVKKIFVISYFLLINFLSFSQKISKRDKNPEKTILFVCEHGAAKSTIAAAYFNKFAKEQGLNYVAVFKGTNPDSVLALGARKGLEKDSFEVSKWVPKLVSEHDIENAYKIITFDCKVSTKDIDKPIEQWNGVSAISKDYDIARNEILDKVKKLINQLPENKRNK